MRPKSCPACEQEELVERLEELEATLQGRKAG
jgi:hypothetical protein